MTDRIPLTEKEWGYFWVIAEIGIESEETDELMKRAKQEIQDDHNQITTLIQNDYFNVTEKALADLRKDFKELQGKLKFAQDQRLEQGKIWLEKNEQLKEIAKESLPFLDRIGGAIHISNKFRKLLGVNNGD